jgi:AcrR family transcriptional regulator
MRQAGNDWFSVKDIARETNVSAGIIYHYFGNKEPLLLEVMKNAFYIFPEKSPFF